MGVVLWFSSMASCADTRSGRVESPIRLFLTQQIASYGRAMGEGRGIFPLILVVCLFCVPGLLLGILIRVFLKKRGFLGLSGFGRLLVYPLGFLLTLKTCYFQFPLGLSF